MGAAAFRMAEYMDLQYMQVAVKAILPAILYFTGIFIAVHLEAKKLGLKGISKDELPKWGGRLRKVDPMIPLVLLVWLVSSCARTVQFSAARPRYAIRLPSHGCDAVRRMTAEMKKNIRFILMVFTC